MSKTVDSRVLEMRFDNKNFESNVSTSMSTLDKLKQKLNLFGSSKSLDGLSSAAKKVDFSGLNSGIDTVHAKFSALQVVGVTALANITNSAVNAGKRMVSALTIEPITSGFQEYETQINSIQTILANTQKEGTNVARVNAALDELNTYADKTIYNFTEMTRNIGTFTAAGVKLDTSVNAIKGIANLAAVSGSTSQQASTAMYQLSQALAAGKVQLMDWNSVVNAGMGGQVFQDALIRTSELLGTGAKAAIDASGSFRESLTKSGWLTTEVLTETLNQLAGTYDKAELMAQGFSESQADEIVKLAETASDAATKVKTFTQLWDTMKEAAQSGWAQTWRTIVGDFEEAKELLTGISDFFTGDNGVITRMSNARNNLLESALGKGFLETSNKVSNAIKKITEPLNKVSETVGKATETIADLGVVVDDVILGKFGNGQERFDKLTESGLNWMTVQNKVNEQLGNTHRYTEEQIAAQDKLIGAQQKTTEVTKETGNETTKLTEAQKKQIIQMSEMSDAQLKAKGYTKEQIAALRELQSVAEKMGVPFDVFINKLEEINGRWLLIDSFKNMGQGLVKVLSSIGKAFRDVFEPIKPEQLFNAIAGFHKFSASMVMSDETAKKLTSTFRGLFSLIHIVTSVIGGGFKLALTVLNEILSRFDMNILDLTAGIGDAITAFDKFILNNKLVSKGFDLIAAGIVKTVDVVKKLAKAFSDIPQVQAFVDGIKDAFHTISDVFSDIKDISFEDAILTIVESFQSAFSKLKGLDLSGIGRNIIQGLQNGLGEGVSGIFSKMIEIGQGIIDAIKGVLGIASPSRAMMAIGGFIIAGLVIGLKNAFPEVWDAITELGSNFVSKCQETFNSISWGKIFAGGITVGLVYFLKQISDAIGSVGDVFDGLSGVFEGVSGALGGLEKMLKGMAFDKKMAGIQKLAISIAILAGTLIALSYIDTGKLWKSVAVVAALAAILAALAFAIDKMSTSAISINKGGVKVGGLKTSLLAIGTTLLLMAATVKLVGSMNPEQAKQGFIVLTGVVLSLIGLMLALAGISHLGKAGGMSEISSTLMKLSIALLLLAGVCKLVGMLSPDELKQGAAFAAAFVIFVGLLAAASRLAGDQASEIGGMVLKLSVAMILLVGFCKLVGGLSPGEMFKGAVFAGAFLVFVGALVLISKLFPQAQIQKISGLVLSISLSLLLMVGVCKLVGMLKPSEMVKGALFAGAFLLMIKALVKILTIGNDQQMAQVALTILAMSVAIGILAAVSIVLGLVDLGGLAKGVVAVGILGAIMTAMIQATRGAEDVKGSIMAMAVAIGVMAVAIVALSMIDGGKLAGATAALSILMGMFALMAKAAGTMQASMSSLIMMGVIVGLLAAVLYLLSGLPIESTLGVAASLSVLLLSMSASMAILGTFGDSVGPQALIAIGVMTVVVGALAAILGIMASLDIGSTMGIALSLSTLLLAMSAACLILAGVGFFGSAALFGIEMLGILVAATGAVLVAIGALVAYVPQVEEFLDKGIPILEKIGYALGSFAGNIISGFAEGAMSGLPKIGTMLSEFMLNATPFLVGAKMIDESSMNGVKMMAEAIMILTGSNILDSVTSIFTGGTSLADFGEQLVPFGEALGEFGAAVAGIDGASIQAAANAGKTLAEMASSLPNSGGWAGSIFGENDMGAFGTQLVAFGVSMKAYSVAVAGLDTEAISTSVSAAKSLIEVANTLQNTGGFVKVFTGDNDLGTFGRTLVPFGVSMKAYSVAVSGLDTEAISTSVSAAKGLVQVANSLENTGGLLSGLVGDNDLGTFGDTLADFGKGMKKYGEAVSGINPEAITASVSAARGLVRVANSLEETGGLNGLLDGKKDLGAFGNTLSSFGKGMKKYGESVVGLDAGAIEASVGAAKGLVKVANTLSNANGLSGLSGLTFNFNLASFGKSLKSYGDSVAGLDASGIQASVSAAKSIVSLINSVSGINASGVGGFVNAINMLGKAQVAQFVAAFSNASPQMASAGKNMMTSLLNGIRSQTGAITTAGNTIINNLRNTMQGKSSMFTTVGRTLMQRLIGGINSMRGAVANAASSTLSSAASGLRRHYSSFYSAGSYVASGFANGIRANISSAARAAAAMASSASAAARNNLQINSPSKVFMKIGGSVPEGFAKGIKKYGYYVDNSIGSMTKTALNGTKAAISRIGDVINSDVDAQPTIRPVLDLSAVQAGAGAVNGLFDRPLSIGATANINRLASMATKNLQNGNNDDVISAIDRLGKKLNNIGNTTNYVNGVTYDDGSNIADAVKSLVRAAKVERRI